MTILGIIIVDAWKVWSMISCDDDGIPIENQKTFYGNLAAELIDNKIDRTRRRNENEMEPINNLMLQDPKTGELRRGIHAHVTPTKRKRKGSRHLYQGWCRICRQSKSILTCSLCKDNETVKHDYWLCDPSKGYKCFATHVEESHKDEVAYY